LGNPNFVEANEALSKKDFLYRIKIARKEAKESIFFLRLLDLEKILNWKTLETFSATKPPSS